MKEIKLQVDDEDYLVPSPHACNSANYMDLVADASASSEGKFTSLLIFTFIDFKRFSTTF